MPQKACERFIFHVMAYACYLFEMPQNRTPPLLESDMKNGASQIFRTYKNGAFQIIDT